jgi:hypothetical protein
MSTYPEITIRPAYADDEIALRRLAVLDSADSVPPAPLLLAELDGELRAALSLTDGSAIADPFVRTAGALELLRLRARAQAATQPRRARRRRFGAFRAPSSPRAQATHP